MAKSLRSIKSDLQRKKTIARRIASKTMGLGYWAAIDAQKKEGKVQVNKASE